MLVSLAYIVPLLALTLLAPQAASVTASANALMLGGLAWRVLFPAALLTALGWWRVTGFTTRSTWRSLVPLLPLIVVYAGSMVLLPVWLGVASHSLGYFALVALSSLAVGFGDEAVFRGAVLQALLPRATLRAVLLSSVLWGAQYLGVMAAGVDPALVGLQALHMVGMGIAFAAAVVVTGTIWPLVLIDAVTQTATLPVPGGTSTPDIFTVVVELVMGTLAAAYGIWLLHRHRHVHRHRHAGRSAEDGDPA
ncbi:CPBP family intramembrane glutamic endopeptidase [Georgenia soli]|uniref:CPBP family intramembrane glutamic endopeptidase n=1 Tax=Georgenia soli TaxID=638953 RepID=UPI001FECA33A|nr:CPBP family intramembrane glutamic endopeptidase [Georgenia soli]